MDLTKNSQNPFKLETLEQQTFAYNQYFSLGSNTSANYQAKLEIIQLVCFYWKYLNKKDPEKYKSCVELLQSICQTAIPPISGMDQFIVGLGLICDNLLWGTIDDLVNPNPDKFKKIKDVHNYIINYITQEWMPF